jgi:hypothetical protein
MAAWSRHCNCNDRDTPYGQVRIERFGHLTSCPQRAHNPHEPEISWQRLMAIVIIGITFLWALVGVAAFFIRVT